MYGTKCVRTICFTSSSSSSFSVCARLFDFVFIAIGWNLRLWIKISDQTKPQTSAYAPAQVCWKITVSERSFGDLTICDLLTFHSLDSFHRVLRYQRKGTAIAQCRSVQCSKLLISLYTQRSVSAAKAQIKCVCFYLHHNSAHCDEKTSRSQSVSKW